MGHGLVQWNRGLCLALAVCLVLCLGPGAEALKCKECTSKIAGKCRSRKRTCEDTRENAVCMVRKKFVDDRLVETLMKCKVDGMQCGAEVEFPVDSIRVEIECCSDRDFCSNDMIAV